MAAEPKRLITAEELAQMSDLGLCELVRGEIVKMSPAFARHGMIAGRLARVLGSFVADKNLGEVFTAEAGFLTTYDPDTVRAPDVAFVSNERLSGVSLDAFFPFAPDLAVEIVSPTDRWSDVEKKVTEYLQAGAKLVWVIDPQTQKAHVYRAGGEASIVGAGEELSGEDVVKGFKVRLAELFV